MISPFIRQAKTDKKIASALRTLFLFLLKIMLFFGIIKRKKGGFFRMTHLLTKSGFIMLFCALCASFIRPGLAVFLGITAVFAAIGFLCFGKSLRDISFIFAAAAIGFILSGIYVFDTVYPARALDGIKADIRGTVTEVSAGGGNPVYTVKTDYVGIDGAPQEITVLLSGWDESSAGEYDRISCSVVFYVYENSRMSEILADKAGKISVRAYTDSPMEVIGRDDSSPGYFVHLVREKISSVIYRYFIGDHAPFIEQILIGTRGELDGDITFAFRRSGMSHILAISGMHMVIIVGLFEKIINYRKSEGAARGIKLVILALLTGIYMVIAGLGMSVLRSGAMLIVHYLSRLLLSGSKSLDNLGVAIAAVLLFDSSAACDIGFLMSVFSCCAINVFSKPMKQKLMKALKLRKRPLTDFIAEAFCVSAIAFLAVLPVSAFAFGEVSLVAPVSNLFAGFLIQFVIVSGLLTVILGMIPFPGFLAEITAAVSSIFSEGLFIIADFFSDLPFSSADFSEEWMLIWLFGSAVLIILPALFSKSFRTIPLSAAMSVFVLLCGILLDFIFFSGVSEIRITALESGTAISCSKDGESVLITNGFSVSDRHRLDHSSGGYGTVISIGAQNITAEHDLLTVSKPENAFLSTADALEHCENSAFVSDGTITLSDEDYIEIFSDSAICFETNGITLLYIFSECDIMDMDPKFRRADIIVLENVSPADYPVLRSDYLILRSFGGYYSGTSEIIVLKSGNAEFFAFEGNLMKGRDAR